MSTLDRLVRPVRNSGLLLCLASVGINAWGAGLEAYTFGHNAITSGAGRSAGHPNFDSAFLNPAMMSYVDKREIGVGLHFVDLSMEYDGDLACLPAEVECFGGDGGSLAVIPSLGYVHPLNEKLTFGFSIRVPYGNGIEFDDGWRGRPYVQDVGLLTMDFSPSLAYQFNETWSFGIALDIRYVDLTQKLELPSFEGPDNALSNSIKNVSCAIAEFWDSGEFGTCFDGTGITNLNLAFPAYISNTGSTEIEIEGDDWALGWHTGITFQPSENHRFGLVYRSATAFTIEGEAKVKGTLLGVSNRTLDMEANFDVPDIITFGGWHRITDQLEVMWDLSRFFYDTYDVTHLDIELLGRTSILRNWEHSDQIHLGFNYIYSPKITLGAGVSRAETSVSDSNRSIDSPLEGWTTYTVGMVYQLSDQLKLITQLEYVDLYNPEVNQMGALQTPAGNVRLAPNLTEGDFENEQFKLGVALSYTF